MTMREILIYLYLKYDKDWDRIYEAICTKEKIDKFELINTLEYEDLTSYITIIDNNYPSKYKSQFKPPFVLEIRDESRCC